MATGRIVWTTRELTQTIRARQQNQFDANIGVSGNRGDGKSTAIFKIMNSFKKQGFNQRKHQVYGQKDIIALLALQTFSFCWDDEGINSGYKRDFQKEGQKKLIKVVTNYRDNFNVYATALPFFYNLDKGLRELIFMHIHIVERGVAVILLPIANQIHSQDPWDTKTNQKIEEREYKRLERNPNARFRYERFTTFAGYWYFGDMTKKQRSIYNKIKKEKRHREHQIEEHDREFTFKEKAYQLLMQGKLTKDGLIQICIMNDKKYSSIISELNIMLKNNGESKTVSHFLRKEQIKSVNTSPTGGIIDLVPLPSA